MYFEAVEDGVRIEDKAGGGHWYYPKCRICGEEVRRISYKRGHSYACPKCNQALKSLEREIKEDEIHDLKERKFETAVKRMSKGMNEERFMEEYRESAHKVYKKLHTVGWFDSIEEMMVAVELIKNGLKISHHRKVGNYETDFIIPSMKVVLEVDGKLYHSEANSDRDAWRDMSIKAMLGEDWEVVRIPTDQINKNIRRLIPAIEAVLKKRKELRNENQGSLPMWYSRGRMV